MILGLGFRAELLVGLVALVGCGRIYFDPRSDAADAGAPACASGVRVGPHGQGTPSVHATDAGFAVAWIGNGTVDVSRIDDTGAAVTPSVSFGTVTSTARVHRPSLAVLDTTLAVGWDETNLRLTILDVDLTVMNDVIVSTNAPRGSSVVATPAGFAIAWADNRFGNYEVLFARFDSTGAPLGGTVRVTVSGPASELASLAWSGAEYMVAWQEGGGPQVHLRRISVDGTLLGTELVATTGLPSKDPNLVWAEDGYALTWLEDRTSSQQTLFMRLEPDGSARGARVELTSMNGWIVAHDLAWSGSQFLAAMAHEGNTPTGGGDSVFYLATDASGAGLAPIEVLAPTFNSDSQFPSVAVRGDRVMVVQNQIFGPDGPGVYAFCR